MFTSLLLGASSAAIAASAVSLHEPEGDVLVVTASPLERSANDLISPVSILSGDELQRQLRGTLGETLSREPGVSTTAFGAGASRPIIRGLGGDRVRTLTNGIGSIDAASSSPDHATPIDPVLAESIEVIRGTGLLRYGSSAAGGVVNVLDGRIPNKVPEERIDGAFRLAGTTVDDGSDLSGGASILLGRFSGADVVFTALGSTRSAGDYDIPGAAESSALRALEAEEGAAHEEPEGGEAGVLENSFVDYDSFAAGLSFIGDRGFFGFSYQDTATDYGVPGHGHEGEGGAEAVEGGGVFIGLEQQRFDVNASVDLPGFFDRLDIFAGYADYTHTEFEAPGEPGTVFTNEGYEIRSELHQKDRGNWRGASGLQYRSRDFAAIGEEAFVSPNQTEQWGVFSFQELVFGPLTAEASWRFEDTNHRDLASGMERDFSGLSASLGSSYRVNEALRGTLRVFRTVRAPTADELVSDGPHLATQSFDRGDLSLDEEIAVGAELGARLGNDRASIGINLFYTDYQGFIYQRDTGLTGADILLARGETDPAALEEFGELTVFAYSSSDATFTGFEVEAEAELGNAWGWDWSADILVDDVDAKIDGGPGHGQLPRIPPLGVLAGFDVERGRVALRAEADYAAKADDVAEFELPTEAFTLVNLYADVSVTERVTLSLAALNVGDEEARMHTSFLKDQAPLPGRNIRFSLRYTF